MHKDAICFGFNAFCQIPEDPSTPICKYFNLQSSDNIQTVSFSWSACYFLTDTGDIYVSRYFNENYCKKGKNCGKLVPPLGHTIIKICCSEKHTLCITESGKCFKHVRDNVWDDITNRLQTSSQSDASGNPLKITDVVSSETCLVFLSDTGLVYNFPLQLIINPIYTVKKVACGFEHGICLTTNGTVLSWGCGRRGQLGNGELGVLENPEILFALDGLTVIDIAAGGWHSAALTDSGDVYTWGWNCFGQLGTGNEADNNKSLAAIPSLVKWPLDVEAEGKSVHCGSRHTMVLFQNGTLWGCGWNKYGQVNPYSKQEHYYEMTRILFPLHYHISDVACATWNTAVIYYKESGGIDD